MHSLEHVFEDRRADRYHQQMIDNLAVVVEAHDNKPVKQSRESVLMARANQHLSGVEGIRGIKVDRHIGKLASFHGVSADQLVAFADSATVVDIGAGKSSFLDSFSGGSTTLAVDRYRPHVGYQKTHGHEGLVAHAHGLGKIPTASVRLVHATFSAPFWSASVQESAQTAHEYIRILEPGGMALIGPTSGFDSHQHYEYVVSNHRYGGPDIMPWPTDSEDDASTSHIMSAFSKAVLDRRSEHGGDISLTGHRVVLRMERDNYEGLTALHVPNFLMIRKDK